MMSCITPTKRLDMWFKDLSVKTTEYSSSPSGSTSRRGRLTSADCHKTPSHWSANLPLRGTQRPHRTHLDGAGEVRSFRRHRPRSPRCPRVETSPFARNLTLVGLLCREKVLIYRRALASSQVFRPLWTAR